MDNIEKTKLIKNNILQLEEYCSLIKNCSKDAGIKNFVFHDYRHTCITNWRRAGIDYLTIMRMSGHKTMSCFKRYNTIDDQDLIVAVGKVDTFLATRKEMDTTEVAKLSVACK